jgi:CRP/FNR family transcriptional regulator, anaerobic regulatory protein
LPDRSRYRDHAIDRRPAHPPAATFDHPQRGEPRSIFLLIDGWVSSSFLVHDGRRQIVKIHLPGDMLATTSMCVDLAIDTLTAITAVAFRKVSLETMGILIESSPRIASFLLLTAQKERIALMDRVASVAQTDPKARFAAFLLSLNARLAAVNQSSGDSFLLPLTQEQIGEILGFTAVHANRVVREFEREGMIERSKRMVRLLDTGQLRAIAGIPARLMSSDTGWLNPLDRDRLDMGRHGTSDDLS